jgi:dTDP-4-amino-4,6-dideoxygalactose transaminase
MDQQQPSAPPPCVSPIFPGEEGMNAKARIAAGLWGEMTGRHTPFLSAYWGPAERQAVKDWRQGADFSGAPGDLTGMLGESLGPEWAVRAVNLGRSAIQLALQAMDLPPGSEVVLPAFSCNGVAIPVLQAGHHPVLADVDEHFNLSFDSVVEAYSPRVRAVIVPHLSGLWSRDTFKILEWAKARGIWVIEDAAQAMGLHKDGRPAGTFGDAGIFSCSLGKQILGPGGGWLVTRHPGLAQKALSMPLSAEPTAVTARRLRVFADRFASGTAYRGWKHVGAIIRHKVIAPKTSAHGFAMNRISDIEARLILLQYPKLGEMIRARREHAARWRDLLSGYAGKGRMRLLPMADNICTKMLAVFPGPGGIAESHAFSSTLSRHGIETEPSYVPLYLRAPYAGCRRTSMATTEGLWRGALAIPVRANLDAMDWKRIEKAVRRLENGRGGT